MHFPKHELPRTFFVGMKRRWESDESDSSDSDSSSDGESDESESEWLTPKQKKYLEIGDLFLKKGGLQWWFHSFGGPFTFASDCRLSL